MIGALMLSSRDILGGIDWVKANKEDENIAKATEKSKKAFAGGEIQEKKLGVIGLGAIGAEIANAAAALGMEVLGYNPFISVKAAWMLSREVRPVAPLTLFTKNVITLPSMYRQRNYKRHDQSGCR